MATVTIDDRKVEIEEGKPIVEAAKKAGITIPTLCHNEMIQPYAVCRICSVEIVRGKRRRIVTACNYPVADGLIINTNSERVRRIRKMILELLLARCSEVPVLRQLAEEYGLEESRFGRGKEECILCGLCVRVCDEIVGARAIAFANRGGDRLVTPPFGKESEACIACGACAFVCPTGAIKLEELEGREVVHEDLRLGPPKAVSIPFLQAVPNKPVIDPQTCIHFITGECGICEKVCEPQAIKYDQEETQSEIDVGNIIIATGFDQFDPTEMQQFGYGRLRNVVTALEFERMNCAAGATGGKIFLADGTEPKSVGILHCIGSRDKNYFEYCSRVCCMYALKYAHLIKEKIGAEVYNFYIDLRCFGKGYEEFYHRLLEEGVRFIRGKAAEVTDFALYKGEEGKLIIRCEDTLVGAVRRIPVDMIVLCAALKSREDAKDIARVFSCSVGKDGFFIEKHPKLAPVSTNTDGIFIAGTCQGPKDIPDTVAQGSAAAAQVLSLIMKGKVEVESAVAFIDEEKCSGCKICNELCPYQAIPYNEEKKVSEVNAALCKGCGTCVAACPRAAITGRHFTDKQILSEIEGIMV